MDNKTKARQAKAGKTVMFLMRRMDCHNGVAVHCEALIQALKNRGWNAIIVSGPVAFDAFSKHRYDSLIEKLDVWTVFEELDKHPYFPGLDCFSKVSKLIEQYNIKLIHAHGFSVLPFARALTLFCGLPSIETCHVLRDFNKLKLLPYLHLFSSNQFIAISTDIKDFLTRDIKIAEQKVHKITHGVDTSYFRVPSDLERRKAREFYQIADDEIVCTLVGRMTWRKGHKVLIDAVRQAQDNLSGAKFTCLIAGSGSNETEIEAYALKSSADKSSFKFLGEVKDIRRVYWAADIAALPSRQEGFPLVIVEAMSCGVVPVRTPAAGASDQIEEGKTGFVFPFEDAEALARILLDLTDGELRQTMSNNCARFARNCLSRDLMIEKTAEVYEKTCLLNQGDRVMKNC